MSGQQRDREKRIAACGAGFDHNNGNPFGLGKLRCYEQSGGACADDDEIGLGKDEAFSTVHPRGCAADVICVSEHAGSARAQEHAPTPTHVPET